MRIAAFCICAVLAAAPAAAQTDALPEWSQVETVVVNADEGGPAMWQVSRGDSHVWILGAVQPLPEGLQWNSARLEKVVTGARAIYTQPRASAGILGGIWFFLTNRDAIYLPGDDKVEGVLPEPLLGRFMAARKEAGKDADRYEDYRLPIAALMLESDVLKERGFAGDVFEDRLRKIARNAGVAMRPIADYDALKMLKELPKLSAEQNLACVNDALDDIDQLRASARPSAEAWADGDLAALMAAYRQSRFERCLAAVSTARALWERSVRDTLAKVDDALSKPGKVLIVVGIDALLRKNGVLERLRAKGFTVDDPVN